MFGSLYFGESYFAGHSGDGDVFPPPGVVGVVAPTHKVGIVSS
jgi:hypothetical protein